MSTVSHLSLRLLPAVLTISAASLGAAAAVRWLETDYDFGVMKESAGRQTGFARFINEGPDTTFIAYVRPSCGCTDADWTREPLAPGDTASVSFTYNPVGRPGMFEKTVKVYVGPEKERHVIRIRGTVVGTPETLALHYPIDCGSLRLSQRLFDLGDVRLGTGRHVFLQMVNVTMDSITPSWENPKGLSVDVTPRTLGPGDTATMGTYLNSSSDAAVIGDREWLIPLKADSCITDITLRAKLINREEQK